MAHSAHILNIKVRGTAFREQPQNKRFVRMPPRGTEQPWRYADTVQ
jgi:hypothetical protein